MAAEPGRAAAGRSAGSRCPSSALERGGNELDDLVVVDVACCRDDDVPGHVHLRVVPRKRVSRDRRDHLGRADHRASERMVGEDGIRDQVVHELLRRVVVHRDLLQHDLALRIELRERRREHHVAHHIHRRLEMVIGDPPVHERVLARGRGIQLAAEPVEDLGDLQRAEPLGALEEQVLDEVRDAGFATAARRVSRRRSSSRRRPTGRGRAVRR